MIMDFPHPRPGSAEHSFGDRHPMPLDEFERLISDYVAGDLDEPRLSRFEETLLANPQWAEWVEAEQMLREGVRELARREPAVFDNAPLPPTVLPLRPTRPAPWFSRGLALAATLTGAALLWNANHEISQLRSALAEAEAPTGEVAFIRFDDMRALGGQALTPISAPAAEANVLIEVPAGPQPLPAYRVRVLRDGAVSIDIASAGVSVEGMVTVALKGKLLKPGRYRLVMTDAAGGTMPVGSYEFTVVR